MMDIPVPTESMPPVWFCVSRRFCSRTKPRKGRGWFRLRIRLGLGLGLGVVLIHH